MKHRGEIVENAVRQSGIPITQVAKRLGKSRRWMYMLFQNSQISFELILEIGKILNHDFSSEISNLPIPPSAKFTTSENEHEYERASAEFWKNKYLELMEKYTELLESRK